MTPVSRIINIASIVFFVYFICLMFYYLGLGLIGLFETRKRSRQRQIEDYAVFSASRFTIPLSIIVPARNEEKWIAECVGSILRLDYPEFEVIVVNDGSTDRTLEILSQNLELQHVNNPYTDRFESGRVAGIFKSKKYPYVTVLNKLSGFKKAGAINAALNLARYKYICVIDADTVLEPDALLNVMAHVQKDPERVVGVGSYFGLANGFKTKEGTIIERRFSFRPLVAYQNLEYIRSFIGSRIAWSKLNVSPIISGGFGIWRRDFVLGLGVFASEYSSEDLEFTFRAHDFIIKNKKSDYKIIMLPYNSGWTVGPENIRSLILQRRRWQRVADETVWRYRYMLCNPKYKAFAFITFPYFLMYEVLGVFFEISSILVVFVGWFFGLLSLKVFISFLLLLILSQALVSLVSLFTFVRDQRLMRVSYIAYLVLLNCFEIFLYRPVILLAKLAGTFGFLRGVKSHDQFARSA